MTVLAEADPAHPAGHALVRVPGAAAAAGSPGFRIGRDAGWGDDKLGPGGWQGSDALLQPDRAEASGPDLVLHLGWAVCRHLECGIYEVSVPAAGVAAEAVFWPDIVPMHAAPLDVVRPAMAAPVAEAAPVVLPAPVAAPVPPKPDPQLPDRPMPDLLKAALLEPARPAALPQPAPNLQPELTTGRPASRGRPAIAILAVLLLALAGGAGYWWLHRGPEPVQAAAVAPEPPPDPIPILPPPPTPPPGPPGLGGLSVPDVLARAPNPAAITAEGQRRLHGDRRDDGLLLLEAAADRADPAAAAALARLYDPILFQPGGPIPRADPRQAAHYYRDAARGSADVAAAREALRRSLEARAAGGDLGASLTLKDFWP